jgi:hypothetical protein|eukprot:scaffold5471_cov212-Alexandrium_tamarense.AAC.7
MDEAEDVDEGKTTVTVVNVISYSVADPSKQARPPSSSYHHRHQASVHQQASVKCRSTTSEEYVD